MLFLQWGGVSPSELTVLLPLKAEMQIVMQAELCKLCFTILFPGKVIDLRSDG